MKCIWPIKLTLKFGKARLLTAMSQCPGAISKAETACFNYYDVKYESGKKLSPNRTFSLQILHLVSLKLIKYRDC